LLTVQLKGPDLVFDAVDLADEPERLGGQHRLDRLGLDELTPEMRPALRVLDAELPGVGLIGPIPTAEDQGSVGRLFRRQDRFDMGMAA
jgi:hypothetical protein